MRNYDYRVEIIRNGARVKELKAKSAPRICFNSDSEIKSGMSGIFKADAEFRPLTDELKVIQIIDGIEYSAGIYSVSTLTDKYTDNEHDVNIESYDRCFLLQSTRTETMYHISSGTNYVEAVKELLSKAGIALYIARPTTSTMSTDREDWDIGTSYLAIINQLLSEINYSPIWFNSDGYAMIQPEPAITPENISHRLIGNEITVLGENCSSVLDIYNAPNVIIAVCNNPDSDTPLTSVAVNDNPLSSLSVFNRGRRISQVYRVDNIADQSALDEYANKIMNESMLTSETVTALTANLPNFGYKDIIEIEHSQIRGLYVDAKWEMTLKAGSQMRHTLRRSVLI